MAGPGARRSDRTNRSRRSSSSPGDGNASTVSWHPPRDTLRRRRSAQNWPDHFGRQESMPFYEKGDVRIRYEEAGRGFPLFLMPGGGLNSRVSNWPNAVFNSMEIFKDEFRCITMDQRNANGGESTGPIPASNSWDAFADDQLGLMDHLGIKRFLFM